MLAVGAVALTPTAMAADANREPTQDTPSVHTKTEINAKPIGEEIVHGKVGYQLWENSEFSFVFPLLSRHPDPEILEKINSRLKEIVLNELSSQMPTPKMPAPIEGMFYSSTIELKYFSPTLLSLVIWAEVSGGSYPTVQMSSHTLDLKRGEEMNFDRLFDFTATSWEDVIKRLCNSDEFVGEQYDGVPEERCSGDEYIEKTEILYFGSPGELVVGGCTWAMGTLCNDWAKIPFSRLHEILKLKPEAKAYLFPDSESPRKSPQ